MWKQLNGCKNTGSSSVQIQSALCTMWGSGCSSGSVRLCSSSNSCLSLTGHSMQHHRRRTLMARQCGRTRDLHNRVQLHRWYSSPFSPVCSSYSSRPLRCGKQHLELLCRQSAQRIRRQRSVVARDRIGEPDRQSSFEPLAIVNQSFVMLHQHRRSAVYHPASSVATV